MKTGDLLRAPYEIVGPGIGPGWRRRIRVERGTLSLQKTGKGELRFVIEGHGDIVHPPITVIDEPATRWARLKARFTRARSALGRRA